MDAFCGICGARYDIRDPAITRWWGTDEWACTDEAACFQRRAEANDYIDAGIDRLEEEANR